MDLKICPEARSWPSSHATSTACPGCAALVSRHPAYQIHEWVDVAVLSDVAPQGTRVPDGAIGRFASFFAALGRRLTRLP
jgi:hypothetical protein